METLKIVVVVDGGVVQTIFSNMPTDIKVLVADYDTDGYGEESVIEDLYGGKVCKTCPRLIDPVPNFVESIFTLME